MKRGEESPVARTLKRPAVPGEIDRDFQAIRESRFQLLGGLACAISCVILFAWLAEEVFEGDLQRFDSVVRAMIHAHSGPELTRIMQGLTFLGSSAFLAALFVLLVMLFLARGMRLAAMWLAVAACGSVVLGVSLKLAFQRARPVPFFGPVPLSYSFPSGHALSSLCFYGVLAGLLSARMKNQSARIVTWLASGALIAGIGFSRIYLGVHYPTDVIAGYLAAAVWVSTLLFTARMRRRSPKAS